MAEATATKITHAVSGSTTDSRNRGAILQEVQAYLSAVIAEDSAPDYQDYRIKNKFMEDCREGTRQSNAKTSAEDPDGIKERGWYLGEELRALNEMWGPVSEVRVLTEEQRIVREAMKLVQMEMLKVKLENMAELSRGGGLSGGNSGA